MMKCCFRRFTTKPTTTVAAILGCLAPTILRAQDPASNAAAAKPTDADRVIVNEVAATDRVSPLERPVSSVYGTDQSILDTPRSVNVINSAQQRDSAIEQVTDFEKLIPSSFTLSQFGGPNIPYIRGQSAEIFQNGMLRTPRSDGQPLSFNGVEAFDVVAGPATVVYGPTGNVGGYVNLVTKRPYFDGYHGFVSATYGDYSTRRWQADVGGPITKELAWRVSYEGEDSRSYFRFQHTQSQDVYLALSYVPNAKFKLDFNTEFFEADYFENTGINRPTQQLIDHDTYIQGTGVSPFAPPGAADPRGFLAVVTPTGTTNIDHHIGLVAPTDGDYGKNYQAQLDVSYQFNDRLTLVNKSYFEFYQQQQLEFAQRYYNNIDESYNFENRTELHASFDLPIGGAKGSGIASKDSKDTKDAKSAPGTAPTLVLKNDINTGFAFRWIHTLAFADFYNEYLNATDITGDPAKFPITSLFGVLPVPGDPSQSATPGGTYKSPLFPNSQPGTLDQDAYQFGLFYQHDLKINDQFSVLFGGRGDIIYENAQDPLPPPGFQAAGASTVEGLGAGNFSATYKPVPWNTNYFTFNFNQSAVTGNGGGFAALTNNTLLPSDFHVKNFLYEAGSKIGLFKNTLFASVAAFYQQRSITNQFAVTNEVDVRGVELQASYQPNKLFYGTFSVSYLDATEPDATGALTITRDVYDAFAPPTGTGVGSPNFATTSPTNTPKTYRLAGLPHLLVNGFAKYRLDCGLGASLGFRVTSPIPTTELGNVVIPWQHTMDAAVFYEAGRYEARLDFFNITNQYNWRPIGNGFGADLINPELPFHIQGSVRFKF